LPGKKHSVAGLLDFSAGELVVDQFGFLKTQYVDRIGAQPIQHMAESNLQ
jgi:hypothetical protein